jgi:phage terminase large subunit-like protein
MHVQSGGIEMTEAERYAREVLEPGNEWKTGKWIKLAAKRFLSDLERDDIHFDIEEAERVVNFIENFCCHWEDSFAGKPFKLEPWQAFIVQQIFAWKVKATGIRRTRTAYIQVARKNGKSILLAAIALYHLFVDKVNSPQILVGSNNEDQAKICVNSAGQVIKKSPKLRHYIDRGSVDLFEYRKKVFKITNSKNSGEMMAMTGSADTKDGFNPSMAIIDEYHEASDDSLLNVFQDGQGAREQPLQLTISTAGYNKAGPCYSKLRKSSVDMLDGKIVDDTHLAFVYEMDEADDWKDRTKWLKPSPNWGISVRDAYMGEQYQKAVNEGGTKEVSFKTKNLNMWCDADKTWIPNEVWIKNTHGINTKDLIGKTCYGGLDCAKSVDINAFSLIFPDYFEKNGKEIIPMIHLFWIPEAKTKLKIDRVDYKLWIDQGWIKMTGGNIVDYNFIEEDIVGTIDQYDFRGLDYDHVYAGNVASNLATRGYECAPLGQSHGPLTGGTEEFHRLSTGILFEHFNNPVISWMVGNVVINRNAKGYEMPDKEKSQNKIDGVSSTVNALTRWKRVKAVNQESTIIWI